MRCDAEWTELAAVCRTCRDADPATDGGNGGYLCEDCAAAHKKQKGAKRHDVDALPQQLLQAQEQVQACVDHLHHAFTTASQCHQACMESKDEVIADIRRVYDELIATLTEQRDRLIARVEDDDDRHRAMMQHMKQQMEEIRAQVKRTEDVVRCISQVREGWSGMEEVEALKARVVEWAVEKVKSEDIPGVKSEKWKLKVDEHSFGSLKTLMETFATVGAWKVHIT